MRKEAKTPADSTVEMTEMVLPQHTNAMGTVFGGTVMSWVDICAASCATRHSGRQVVTASVDALEFLAPVSLGWIVSLKASVNYVGSTSCEVGVRVVAENPITSEHFHTASAYLTMVAKDSNGNPTKMPDLQPVTAIDRHRHEEARSRKKARLELKRANRERRKVKDQS